MKRYIFLLTIVFSSISFAQQYDKAYLDSLYNQYISIRERPQIQNAVPGQVYTVAATPVVKCGFGPANFLRLNIEFHLKAISEFTFINPAAKFQIIMSIRLQLPLIRHMILKLILWAFHHRLQITE